MLNIGFAGKDQSRLKVLCLGAHSDDIEIGCGGAILRLLEQHPAADVRWVVFGASGERVAEAQHSADLFLQGAGSREVVIKDFADGFFPYNGAEIKRFFETLKPSFVPDVIFTHYRHDLHQDHRVISELTWNTYRNHLILEYEIIKYDGDLGTPNFFVHLPQSTVQRKIANLMAAFKSQTGKHWFTDDTFTSLLRLRGLESNAPEKYAEAFYCRKVVY